MLGKCRGNYVSIFFIKFHLYLSKPKNTNQFIHYILIYIYLNKTFALTVDNNKYMCPIEVNAWGVLGVETTSEILEK